MIKSAFAIFIGLMFASPLITTGQDKTSFDQIGATHLLFGYGIEWPVGDLANRFGQNLNFSVAAERMTKSNFVWGVKFSFMFGTKVKEDVLKPLRLDNGEILGADNAYADIALRQRGLYLGAYFGKTFRLDKKLKSGIRLTNALGVFQHHIRINKSRPRN